MNRKRHLSSFRSPYSVLFELYLFIDQMVQENGPTSRKCQWVYSEKSVPSQAGPHPETPAAGAGVSSQAADLSLHSYHSLLPPPSLPSFFSCTNGSKVCPPS